MRVPVANDSAVCLHPCNMTTAGMLAAAAGAAGRYSAYAR